MSEKSEIHRRPNKLLKPDRTCKEKYTDKYTCPFNRRRTEQLYLLAEYRAELLQLYHEDKKIDCPVFVTLNSNNRTTPKNNMADYFFSVETPL